MMLRGLNRQLALGLAYARPTLKPGTSPGSPGWLAFGYEREQWGKCVAEVADALKLSGRLAKKAGFLDAVNHWAVEIRDGKLSQVGKR